MRVHAAGHLRGRKLVTSPDASNTANLEVLFANKELISFSTSARPVRPMFRLQSAFASRRSRFPYALLDGRFLSIAGSYRKLGELTGRQNDANDLAGYAEQTVKRITDRIADIPLQLRPRVYYARGPRGLSTSLGGSINVETIEFLARNAAGAQQRAA